MPNNTLFNSYQKAESQYELYNDFAYEERELMNNESVSKFYF